MDLVWWLPATVLVLGSVVLLARIRVIQREIAATSDATDRLAALAEGGTVLTTAVARTELQRARTLGHLSRQSAGPVPPAPASGDRGPSGTDR